MSGRRDSIVGLASIALVLTAASVIAGRLGVSDRAIASLCIGLAGLATIAVAVLSRSMRVPIYRSALGSIVPAAHCGLIVAAGLAVLLAWPGATHEGAAVSVMAAIAVHAGWSAPGLIRSGTTVFAEIPAHRFGSQILRVLVALALSGAFAVIAALAVQAAIASLGTSFGLDPVMARWLVPACVAIILLPGGMAGLAGVAALAAVLAIAGWLLPFAALAPGDLAETGALAENIASRLGGDGFSPLRLIGWALAALGGLIALDTAQPARSPKAARRTMAVAVLLVPLVIAASFVGPGLVSQRTAALFVTPIDRLPAGILSDRAQDQIEFCGQPHGDARALERACEPMWQGGRLPADAIAIEAAGRGRWLATVLDLPAIAGVLYDLAKPAILIILATLLLHGSAGMVVHDGLYPALRRQGTASGRLALHRLTALGLAWGASLPMPVPAGLDPTLIVSSALGVLAALPAPLMLLGLWPRADWKAATCGLAAAAAVIAAPWFGRLAPDLAVAAAPAAFATAAVLAALLFPAGAAAPAPEAV